MTDRNEVTNHEKLIEEARDWEGALESPTAREVVRRLADALEAAGKALTPTEDEREALARWCAFAEGRESAQGEPSDAQLLAQGFRDGVDFIDDQPGPWGAAVVAGRAEAARRVAAAGGVR